MFYGEKGVEAALDELEGGGSEADRDAELALGLWRSEV